MIWWWLACASSPEGTSPVDLDTSSPSTSSTPSTTSPVLGAPQWISAPTPGAYRYVLSTEVPTTLTLAIDDGRTPHVVRYLTGPTTYHDVPVLGVHPDRTVSVVATVTDAEGRATELTPLTLHTGPLGLDLPNFDVLQHEPGSLEPGLTLVPLQTSDRAVLVAIDAMGDPVWGHPTEAGARGVTVFGDAELITVIANRIVHSDAAGTWRTVFGRANQGGVTVDVGYAFHHDVWVHGDGTFTALSAEPIDVPEYPIDAFEPEVMAPARIRADLVVTFEATGLVRSTIALADLLDTRRIGFGATNASDGLPEWTHANAVVATDRGFVVSSRHQDAVIGIDVTNDQASLGWILSHDGGWVEPWSSARLVADDPDLTWPFHQHAPDVRETADGMYVLVFDNGNGGRISPYAQDPHPDGDFSRAVEYRIDEAQGTVEQTFEFIGDGQGTLLYSPVMGNADHLPVTGHVLVTYPALFAEGETDNSDLGLGERTIRVLEVERETGQPVWDLRVSGPADEAPTGWRADRVTRIPSLYGDLAEVTWDQ